MKLSMLYEAFGSGAIAARPASFQSKEPRNLSLPKDTNTGDRWYWKFSKVDRVNVHEGKKKKNKVDKFMSDDDTVVDPDTGEDPAKGYMPGEGKPVNYQDAEEA
jgi:hypothetical protein